MPVRRPSKRKLTSDGTFRIETPDALKERLRERFEADTFDVSHFYHKTGFFQRIARAPWFENLIFIMIGFNALWIWIDVDYNGESSLLDAHPIFIVLEIWFCIVFAFEWLCRFGAFRQKRDCCKDHWFIFDSIMVLLMIMETFVLNILVETGIISFGDGLGQLSILRVLRLLRLTRMAKLMSYIPEMVILTKGLAEGMRSVSLTMLLLAMLTYTAAIAMTQMSRGTPLGSQYFASVPQAMYTLLIYGMVPDIGGVMEDLENEWHIALIFVVFVFISTFAILNLLIGILCGVVSTVSHQEKQVVSKQLLKGALMKVMVEQIDADHDGLISKSEFHEILLNPDAVSALLKYGFDVVALVDLAEVLFDTDKSADEENEVALTFDEFMAVLFESRSTQPATQKDVRDLQRFIMQVCNPTASDLERMGVALTTSLRPKLESLEESDGSEAELLANDGEPVLEELAELRNRMDALEGQVTTVAATQPELQQRLNSLEVLILKVADSQRQLLYRVPSEEVLRKFNNVISTLHEQLASPSRGREMRGLRRKGSRSLDVKRDLDPCRMLFTNVMQDYP